MDKLRLTSVTLIAVLLVAGLPVIGWTQEIELTQEDFTEYFKNEVLSELEERVGEESWVLDPQFREPTLRDKEEYLRSVGELLYNAALYRKYFLEEEFPSDPHILIEEEIIEQWPENPFTGQPMRVVNMGWFSPGDMFWGYSGVPCVAGGNCGTSGVWIAMIGRERGSMNYWEQRLPNEDFSFDSTPVTWPPYSNPPANYYVYLADSTYGTKYDDICYTEIEHELRKRAWSERLEASADYPVSEARTEAVSVTADELKGTEVEWSYLAGGETTAEGRVTLGSEAFQRLTVDIGDGNPLRFYAFRYPAPDGLPTIYLLLDNPGEPHYPALFPEHNLLVIAESSVDREKWLFTVDDKMRTETKSYIPRSRVFYEWSATDKSGKEIASGTYDYSGGGYVHVATETELLFLSPGIELAEVPADIHERRWREIDLGQQTGRAFAGRTDEELSWDVQIEIVTGEESS